MTMPSSATGRTCSAVENTREPERPDRHAGDEISDDRREAEFARNRHADDRRAEQRERQWKKSHLAVFNHSCSVLWPIPFGLSPM